MDFPKNIIWLASYPKSGNTWFRVFLTNLLRDCDEPADINDLERTPIASARNLFDDLAGVPASDLSFDEIDSLRPDVYMKIAQDAKEPVYQKVHDAYIYIPHGRPLIPPEATRCAVYFVRNPLDVAVSFAHHTALSYDAMIKAMVNPDYSFCSKPGRLHNQLRQKLLSWSGHIRSWTEQNDFPVHIMKYEDMLADTFSVFKDAVYFIGLEKSDEQIRKAIRFSSFEELKKQEEQEGFNEKAPNAESFFRKGISGSWKEELTAQQIGQIVRDHGEMMERYGYL